MEAQGIPGPFSEKPIVGELAHVLGRPATLLKELAPGSVGWLGITFLVQLTGLALPILLRFMGRHLVYALRLRPALVIVTVALDLEVCGLQAL